MTIYARTLLPATGILRLENMEATGDGIIVIASTTQSNVSCTKCGQTTCHLHSRYQRTVADLPWQGIAVKFRLNVRKFFCDNGECERRIFTEPLPQILVPYARKTIRLTDALQELAFLAFRNEKTVSVARQQHRLQSVLVLPLFHPLYFRN